MSMYVELPAKSLVIALSHINFCDITVKHALLSSVAFGSDFNFSANVFLFFKPLSLETAILHVICCKLLISSANHCNSSDLHTKWCVYSKLSVLLQSLNF